MRRITEPPLEQHPSTLDWEVVDLLLSDDRVVQEMFEEIVTAEWLPAPPVPAQPPRGATGSGDVNPEHRSEDGYRASGHRRTGRPGTDGWARERSPPYHDGGWSSEP
jgi:hypothetical protein